MCVCVTVCFDELRIWCAKAEMSNEKETLDVKVLVVVCDEKRRDEETKRRGEK